MIKWLYRFFSSNTTSTCILTGGSKWPGVCSPANSLQQMLCYWLYLKCIIRTSIDALPINSFNYALLKELFRTGHGLRCLGLCCTILWTQNNMHSEISLWTPQRTFIGHSAGILHYIPLKFFLFGGEVYKCCAVAWHNLLERYSF